MKFGRDHHSTIVFLRFNGGEYWEEWRLRTNRGNKLNKPVKFFADRLWRSDNTRALVPFAGMDGSYPSERQARERFTEEVCACGGEVVATTVRLLKELSERFGRGAA